MFLKPSDEREVCRTSVSLKNTDSADVDDRQAKPVKYVIHALNAYLIWFCSLVCFWTQCKRQLFRLSLRVKKEIYVNNSRPVSIPPPFSMFFKAHEKIIVLRIKPFLSKHNLLENSLHAFHQGKSTESALLNHKELITKILMLTSSLSKYLSTIVRHLTI